MVTFLRPHHHAHGPPFCLHFTPPRTTPAKSRLPLTPMAQDPSHPHKQQPHQEPGEQPPPPQEEEPSSSTSGDGDGGGGGGEEEEEEDPGAWLQLGLGPSAPPPPKRRRTDEGPSEPPASPPPPPPLQLSLLPGPSAAAEATAGASAVAAAPPPPAHEAGMWFMLRAAQNQAEPPLPQIPRSYLRIRDGRMTVRVVMRYLANRLGLQEESQVEITCRGQRLPPAMTLQHVRDAVWRPAEASASAPPVLSAPGAPTTEHLMTLYYSRRT